MRKQGKKDLRGRWYNKETREQKTVNDIEETIDKTVWTKEAPIENESYQYFNETNNCWAVDAEKKEAAEQESESARKKAEQKRMLSVLAIFDNTVNEDDLRINEEYRMKILDLRAEIQELGKQSA